MKKIQKAAQSTFYVTTPIFYPTGKPHIGTAYNVFIADTLARYARQQGRETFFLTGTDEHGQNIAKKAEELGQTPQAYVDEQAQIFIDLWQELGISNDFFIRTTDFRHEEFVQSLIQKSFDNGDIYEGEYEGLYCESCESFINEKDLINGHCPNHPTKVPKLVKEKNYYFKWSKYQDWLLDFYEKNPDFVKPAKWFAYVKEMVSAGLNDIPVTRAKVSWGVKVPFDESQTVYVWYDALPNYLSALHFPEYATQGYFEKFWRNSIHVVGKDIIKFHAILWPAMLKSAGFQPPKTILAQGFFTVNGEKIGKSNGNAIDPQELVAKYGTDAVRYALLSEFRIGNDGDFSFERLEVKYRTELSDNWGNLLNRVIHLLEKSQTKIKEKISYPEIEEIITTKTAEYHNSMSEFDIYSAISSVNELAAFGNKFITDKKPWEKNADAPESVLSDLYYLLDSLNQLYLPIMPKVSETAKKALKNFEKVILFPKLD